MFNVSTMTMTMTMTFSSFALRFSSFQVPSFKFQVPSFKSQIRGAIGFFTLHSSLFTLKILHSSLFTFRTANKVQGERRAELARAMLSRSLYSLLQLVCESKVTKNH